MIGISSNADSFTAVGPLRWNVLRSMNNADLVQCRDLGGQAAMQAQHPSINEGCQGKVVEDLAAVLPDGGIPVLLDALVVETVDLRDLPGFMIATEQHQSIGPFELVEKEQG